MTLSLKFATCTQLGVSTPREPLKQTQLNRQLAIPLVEPYLPSRLSANSLLTFIVVLSIAVASNVFAQSLSGGAGQNGYTGANNATLGGSNVLIGTGVSGTNGSAISGYGNGGGGAVRVFRAARVVVVVKVEGLVAPVGSVGAGMARLVAV